MGKKKSESKQTQTSQPLSPTEVSGYFNELSRLTGGGLSRFATTGTQAPAYQAPTDAQIQSLGGLGATRLNQAGTARQQALEQIAADPAMTLFQRQRARQTTGQQYDDVVDAILKESEAAIAQTAMQRERDRFEAGLRRSLLNREDLEALARIYFGGKGQTGTGTGSSVQREGLSDFFSFGLDI